MRCRNCGQEVAEQAVLCVACGVPPRSGTKYCQSCGADTNPQAEMCVSCGVRLAADVPPKSRIAVSLLAYFLGSFGIHRFYLGQTGLGILMLLTLGGLGIRALIDFVRAVAGVMKDKDGKPITNW